MRELLLMSSSKAADTDYLCHSKEWIAEHFAGRSVLFIPYAGVTLSHSDYTARVQTALQGSQLTIRGIESFANPLAAIEAAEGVLVGGGNTFVLLNYLYRFGLINALQRRIRHGMPYAGWSAGANIAGLSIRTTNDMPIVQPPCFSALGVVNFHLNPHYFDNHPPGFHGETRAQRLAEFMQLNPASTVIGLREGTALKISGKHMTLQAMANAPAHQFAAVLFRDGQQLTLPVGGDCSTYL